VHVTGFAPVQAPLWHVSVWVHAFPSLHAVPLLAFVYADVLTAGWHVSHVFAPFVAPAATHAPPIAQNPLFSVGVEHAPVVALQVPAVWQESGAVHVTGFAPTHAPLWHASVWVQAFPSLQDVPLATFVYADVLTLGWHVSQVFAPLAVPEATHAPPISQNPAFSVGAEQTPVAASHVPAVWHASGATHVIGLDPVHAPLSQASVSVHALPSLHAVPLLTFVYADALTPGWHVSQLFAPFVVPAATHTPPMKQPEHAGPPNESWHVTVAPEFMTICLAAIAPTNFAVLIVTSAFVATTSA
jgi:hypothetical protein